MSTHELSHIAAGTLGYNSIRMLGGCISKQRQRCGVFLLFGGAFYGSRRRHVLSTQTAQPTSTAAEGA